MAECLVRNFDSHNSDPEKDECHCWKKGDIVNVQEDGWDWGRQERNLAKFRIVRIPGVSVETVKSYCTCDADLKEDEENPGKSYVNNLKLRSLWCHDEEKKCFLNKRTQEEVPLASL